MGIPENHFEIKEVFWVFRKNGCSSSIVVSVTSGLLLGILSALAWYFGYMQYFRQTVPYAFTLAAILFITIAALNVALRNTETELSEENSINSVSSILRKYSPVIMIHSTIFMVFALTALSTYLPFALRAILAFVGSISFWTMLLSSLNMILRISYRRR